MHPARCNSTRNTSHTSTHEASNSGRRAVITRSYPGRSAGSNGRSAARSRRRARLRRTAVPMARLAVIPIRDESSPLGATTTTTSGWACDLPWRLTRWNSLARCRRNLRCIHFSRAAGGGLRLGMPRLIPHPSAVVCCGVAPRPPWCSPGRCQLRVPVDLLDVSAPDRQACAALGTPCRQYFAAAASCHA
jgi:hypothetical protein